ncbi:hypothetical protein [Brenneria izbisi]|uniref:Uncharacterized protein n=1 Tax=Brenneria izbisi TaxID=2939450 RepID=A0AA42C2T6_9GAMM|nr:hypothetical protein [Brenneria izbisi]MCV9879818.1 hypothetical protein [Brenneria izbisi]MCV9883207.1 hypothetical protein [Brenneria izbisi]
MQFSLTSGMNFIDMRGFKTCNETFIQITIGFDFLSAGEIAGSPFLSFFRR